MWAQGIQGDRPKPPVSQDQGQIREMAPGRRIITGCESGQVGIRGRGRMDGSAFPQNWKKPHIILFGSKHGHLHEEMAFNWNLKKSYMT